MTTEETLAKLQTRLEIATADECEKWDLYQEAEKPREGLIKERKEAWLEAVATKRSLEAAVKLLKEEIQCQPTQL